MDYAGTDHHLAHDAAPIRYPCFHAVESPFDDSTDLLMFMRAQVEIEGGWRHPMRSGSALRAWISEFSRISPTTPLRRQQRSTQGKQVRERAGHMELRGVEGVTFVTSGEELARTLAAARGTRGSAGRPFCHLDRELPRWRRLLEWREAS